MKRIARKLALGITGLALTVSWIGCAHQGIQSPLARWRGELSPKTQTVSAAKASHGANASPSKSNAGLLSRLTKRPTKTAKPSAKPVNDSALWLEQAAQAEIGGRLKEAQDLYAKVCQAEPGHVLAWHRLAVVTTQLDDFPTAWSHYQEALKLAPDNADIWSDAGYCLFRQGSYEQAEKHVREAMKQHPDESRYINNLALIRGVQGHADEALGLFKKCHDEATSLEFMAQIHELRKDPAAAKSARDQAQVARAKKTSQTLAATTGGIPEAVSPEASASKKALDFPTEPKEAATAAASAQVSSTSSPLADPAVKAAAYLVDELPPSPSMAKPLATADSAPSSSPSLSNPPAAVAPAVVPLGHRLAIGNQPRAMEVVPPPQVSQIATRPAVPAVAQGTISIVKSRPLSTPVESLLPIIQPAVMPASGVLQSSTAPIVQPPAQQIPAPQLLADRIPATDPKSVASTVSETPAPLPAAVITRAAHTQAGDEERLPARTEQRIVSESSLMTTIVSRVSPQDVTINQIHAPRTFPMDAVEVETEDPGDAPIFVIRGQSQDAAAPSNLPVPAPAEALPERLETQPESTQTFPVKVPESVEKSSTDVSDVAAELAAGPAPFPESSKLQPQVKQQIRAVDVEWFDSRRQQILGRQQQDLFCGYCPVALREARELVDGRPEFACESDGQRILCSSAEALKLFQSDPSRYLPVKAGQDLVLSKESSSAGKPDELPTPTSPPASRGNLAYASWYEGKLYFFQSAAALKEFHEHPESVVLP
ncbi:Tetratricopeptide TPR_2 repeat protein [Planctopirus limnophila DSM 3776]|uniref:Tetratricopeptide TPR_2 repeat protein n=1 Tax=Planctopirus limnophila (strain ATCC 43296 / DSM 3776 / IFAM 1008 / Mu 290) TaxID=521674 RepID=D5SRY0_PLAL2|nr:tetratricopeptide repeat protein [Planctopirus limnophila]ADG68704.1 Tetratricopeptide TPR_2 repeat protein [Planctopirus limnophila DSM 3776]